MLDGDFYYVLFEQNEYFFCFYSIYNTSEIFTERLKVKQ